MGFFNEDFYKELDKNYKPSEDEFDSNKKVVSDDYDDDVDTTYYSDNINLDVNKNNQDKFKDIMDNASIKYDTYWDSNNLVIKIFLIVLGVIIVAGVIYYIVGWVNLF